MLLADREMLCQVRQTEVPAEVLFQHGTDLRYDSLTSRFQKRRFPLKLKQKTHQIQFDVQVIVDLLAEIFLFKLHHHRADRRRRLLCVEGNFLLADKVVREDREKMETAHQIRQKLFQKIFGEQNVADRKRLFRNMVECLQVGMHQVNAPRAELVTPSAELKRCRAVFNVRDFPELADGGRDVGEFLLRVVVFRNRERKAGTEINIRSENAEVVAVHCGSPQIAPFCPAIFAARRFPAARASARDEPVR